MATSDGSDQQRRGERHQPADAVSQHPSKIVIVIDTSVKMIYFLWSRAQYVVGVLLRCLELDKHTHTHHTPIQVFNVAFFTFAT